MKHRRSRRSSPGFLALPHHMLEPAEYRALSTRAKALLVDIGSQYRGRNNGKLIASWTFMNKRGWRSKEALFKARAELEQAGFIAVTARFGRLSKRPTCYCITWKEVDEAEPSGDVAASKVKPNLWKHRNRRYGFRTYNGDSASDSVPKKAGQ